MRATPASFETKADRAYARIRSMIESGDLRAGERLRLTELARLLGTSEMPVREALRMLQRDGLVTIETHRGATVAEVSSERVYEAVYVRTALEVLAIGDAVPQHDERSVEAMQRLLDRMAGLARRREAQRFSEANRRLHTLLVEPCPYALLKEEIQSLWDRMWLTRARSLFILEPDRMLRAHEEHVAIVDAVARGDAHAARRAASVHRDRTLQAWRRVVEQRRPE